MRTRETLLAVLASLPVDQWSGGRSKSVDDLWRELIAGDCTLELDPLRRIVRVVEVHIERDGRVLIEVAQGLADGTVRPRGRRPAEKLRPDEDPVWAPSAAWAMRWASRQETAGRPPAPP